MELSTSENKKAASVFQVASNLSLRVKLLSGFGVILALMAGMSGASYLTFQETKSNVQTYAQRMDVAQLAAKLDRDNLSLRRKLREYVMINPNAENAKTAYEAVDTLRATIDKAKEIIKSPERLQKLQSVSENFEGYAKNFVRVDSLKKEEVKLVAEGMDTAGSAFYKYVSTAMSEARKLGNAPALQLYTTALEHGLLARLYANQMIGRKDLSYAEKAKKEFAQLNLIIPEIGSASRNTELADDYEQIKKLVPSYESDFDRVVEISTEIDKLINKTMASQAAAFKEGTDAILSSSIEEGKDIKEKTAIAISGALSTLFGLALGGVMLGLCLALILGSVISRPILRMTAAMKDLAGGNKNIEIPALGQCDEIGQMAEAVEVFKNTAIRVERMNEEQAAQKRKAEAEKNAAFRKLADSFEASIGRVIQTVSSAATELQASSTQMASTANDTSAQATTVAGASEESSANVQAVATAAEELNTSIGEIKRQVAHASKVSQEAQQEADQASQIISSLSENANKIGEIVNLINNIASQTNLLALNATIEAARAGDAGKGFAVVAAEVKGLANQTAQATDEIAVQITSVQECTKAAVTAITSVSKVIHDVTDVSTSVAKAVEEQTAVTSEIARNVEQASAGTKEVSSSISKVKTAAEETDAAADQIKTASTELSAQSELLRNEVDRFLQQIRADKNNATIAFWDENMAMGVPAIDDDHRELFNMMNKFFRSLMAGEASYKVVDTMQELSALCLRHIREEEGMMGRINYPYLQEHRSQHMELIHGLDELKTKLVRKETGLEEQVLGYFDLWKKHTQEADAKLVKYAKENRMLLMRAA